ncbi:MAG: hypothetical protein IJZ04_08095 [Clostridia bacterium]|nr:hypothetical protein [Clostridia bacterium]
MKKILSILLALVFCFIALISCGNEENSSSQGECGENSNEDIQSTVKSDYYDKIIDLRLNTNVPNFAIYETYDELLQVIDNSSNDIDKSRFNDNYALLISNLEVPFPYFSHWGLKNVLVGMDFDENETKHTVILQIEVTLEEEGTDDIKYLNGVFFVPKTLFEQKNNLNFYEDNLKVIWTTA